MELSNILEIVEELWIANAITKAASNLLNKLEINKNNEITGIDL